MLEHDFGWARIVGLVLLAVMALGAAAIVVLLTAIAWWEKRHVRCFRLMNEKEQAEIPSYIEAMNRTAGELDFVWDGYFVRTTEGVLRTVWSVFRTPDKSILIVIGQATVGALRQKLTMVFSKLNDGKYLITTDDFGEPDISGRTERQVRLNAELSELIECHRERLEAAGGGADMFAADPVIKELERLNLEQAEALENRGYAGFLDADRTIWRYSLKGALLVATVGFGKQFLNMLAQGHRSHRARPGG
jgi:hypothetical protein